MKLCILMKFILYFLEMSPLLIFIIIIGLISTILQNLAKTPCTSDENTYWFQSHSNFPILETESFNELFESNSFLLFPVANNFFAEVWILVNKLSFHLCTFHTSG